jgi:DNA mismatch repair ATPase MutL
VAAATVTSSSAAGRRSSRAPTSFTAAVHEVEEGEVGGEEGGEVPWWNAAPEYENENEEEAEEGEEREEQVTAKRRRVVVEEEDGDVEEREDSMDVDVQTVLAPATAALTAAAAASAEEDLVYEEIERTWRFSPSAAMQSCQARKRPLIALKACTSTLEPSSAAAGADTDVNTPAPTTAELGLQGGLAQRDDSAAARALARVLSKPDFGLMRVIGQFNLGFIVVELRGDLYILDQVPCIRAIMP